MKWDTSIDGELEQLDELVHNAWCWQFPGWQWVADRLNEEYKNNRTANACRLKSNSLITQSNPTEQGDSDCRSR